MLTPLVPDAVAADYADALADAPADDLVASTYTQLRAIAVGHFAGQPLSHTLQPTALVHEAILKIIRGSRGREAGRWNSREHFLAVAAAAMRQILIDHARGKAAQKRQADAGGGGGAGGVGRRGDSFAASFLGLNEAIDALARVDQRAAQGVMLRFFAGLTIPQTAQVQGVSEFTVERDWRAARAFLARQLAASQAPGAAS